MMPLRPLDTSPKYDNKSVERHEEIGGRIWRRMGAGFEFLLSSRVRGPAGKVWYVLQRR